MTIFSVWESKTVSMVSKVERTILEEDETYEAVLGCETTHRDQKGTYQ